MCYSAQIKADYRDFQRQWGATVSLKRFVELFWEKRKDGGWAKIPKAMREAFRKPQEAEGFELARLVAEADREQASAWGDQLDAQTTRLMKAQAVLAGPKPTKKATDDVRIASNKIEAARRNIDDLGRREPLDRDSRIYPGHYAPVMIEQDGQRIVVPMRYQCRLPGWTPATERKYPGTYNARRDKLKTTWRDLFGYRHGIMLVTRFYENVSRHRMEHRDLRAGETAQNLVLEFDPKPPQEMLVACLWNISPGDDGDPDLFSFAAITDDPPAEVAASGHDRCIVPLKPENVGAWLHPDPDDLEGALGLLADRSPAFYEWQLVA